MQTNSLEGKVILWIEDDTSLRDLVATRVSQEQCIILHAEYGADGLRSAAAQKPDLIMLDIQMLGMDGFEILTRLKADAQTKDVPVIMLSNLDDPESVKRALQLGALDFLAKSTETPGSIVEKMRAALAKSSAQPQ